ncbi:sialoadhesin-like [Astatotilapia calliptera]|uniref:sialoadhesin-like n=1 Tax=Astatotilapia calliptera TaxID=8154 RepID=UPI000E3FF34D|nr:sialoadhesin-like [Astatotilapia calliptera]
MSFVTVQSVNIMTDIMLLSLLLIPSTLAACPQDSHLFITAPTEMEALSGSCLQIPCNFSEIGTEKVDSTRPVFGVWIKNHSDIFAHPNNEIFNSSGTVNIYPMNITGNLKEEHCTTLFSNLTTNYTNTYYFRIMNWPYRATAVCDPLKITIKDSPWRPNITIQGDLKEKESVTITCSALTPCPHSPPQLTWNLQQDSHNKIEKNTDGSFTTKIQQNITLSDTHDGKKISCSARYPVNQGNDTKTAETEETLSVSYAPKDTSASISPSGLVSAGSWVNLTCFSRAKPPVSNFTWFKKSRDGAVKASEGEIYSFNVTDGGVYYCVATNDLGNQTSAVIRVTVAGLISSGVTLWPLIGGIIWIVDLLLL